MALEPTSVTLVCRLEAVREVRVESAPERQAESLRFYGDVLGLTRWPARLEPPGCVGFGPVRRGLVLEMRHDPAVDPNKRRLSLTVASLDLFARQLELAGATFERTIGFWPSESAIVVSDPVGHRIEVRESSVF